MNTINKEELLNSSKWIRFLFMALYALLINFIVLPVCIGLSFIQFLFVLFTSDPNKSIANINEHLIEFFSDSIAFLLFQTEEKPFPFKTVDEDDALPQDKFDDAPPQDKLIIEGEADIIPDESSENPNN